MTYYLQVVQYLGYKNIDKKSKLLYFDNETSSLNFTINAFQILALTLEKV